MLSGCAIGAENSAHVVNRQLVPSGLLTPGIHVTGPLLRHSRPSTSRFFLIVDQDLVAVNRSCLRYLLASLFRASRQLEVMRLS